MKKIATIFILTVFLISLMPVVFAQDRATVSDRDSDDNDKTITKTEIRRIAITADNAGVTKEEIKVRFGDRREALKERLSEIDPEKLRRIDALSKVSIRRIAGVDKDIIENLDADELEKFSNLDRARRDEFSKLNKEDLKKRLEKIKIRKVDKRLEFKKRIVSKQKIIQSEKEFEEAGNDKTK